MGALLSVVLPLSLAFIMLSLGLGLTVDDFARVFRRPRALAAGFLSQVVALPLIAFGLIALMGQGLSQELKVGMMILAFCPGGVTSNIMTRLARGDVALSVSLTAVVSLLSVVTVPLLTAWAVGRFLAPGLTDGPVVLKAPSVDVTSLGLAMFAITAVPVALGVTLRRAFPNIVMRAEPVVSTIATVLFVVIVVGALAANWSLFAANVVTLGPLAVALNVVTLAIGYAIARVLSLDASGRAALAIEAGVQNATLGITVGSLIAEAAAGLPPFSLPSGVYGITMYVVTLPFVWWMRGRVRDER